MALADLLLGNTRKTPRGRAEFQTSLVLAPRGPIGAFGAAGNMRAAGRQDTTLDVSAEPDGTPGAATMLAVRARAHQNIGVAGNIKGQD